MKALPPVVVVLSLAFAPALLAQSLPGYLLGTSVPVAAAARTITVAPDTRWVNVAQGDVVRFVVGAAEFGWRFDGPGSRSFDLQSVAPAGVIGRPLTVYVAPTPGHRSQ